MPKTYYFCYEHPEKGPTFETHDIKESDHEVVDVIDMVSRIAEKVGIDRQLIRAFFEGDCEW